MMEHLLIAATDDTPAVDFHPETGVLKLEGEAYAENPVVIFEPLTNWVTTYIQEIKGPLTLNITITYINTSSSKCMLDFLDVLDSYYPTALILTVGAGPCACPASEAEMSGFPPRYPRPGRATTGGLPLQFLTCHDHCGLVLL